MEINGKVWCSSCGFQTVPDSTCRICKGTGYMFSDKLSLVVIDEIASAPGKITIREHKYCSWCGGIIRAITVGIENSHHLFCCYEHRKEFLIEMESLVEL